MLPTPTPRSSSVFGNGPQESPVADPSYMTPATKIAFIDSVKTPVNPEEGEDSMKKMAEPPPAPERLIKNAEEKESKALERKRGKVQERLPSGFNPVSALTPGGSMVKKVTSNPKRVETLTEGDKSEVASRHADPFTLDADENSTLEASFPFNGNRSLQQLQFYIGDSILLMKKESTWSWGRVIRTGEEGWFPNNYIQGSFRPLPGIHELFGKLGQDKARPTVSFSGPTHSSAFQALNSRLPNILEPENHSGTLNVSQSQLSSNGKEYQPLKLEAASEGQRHLNDVLLLAIANPHVNHSDPAMNKSEEGAADESLVAAVDAAKPIEAAETQNGPPLPPFQPELMEKKALQLKELAPEVESKEAAGEENGRAGTETEEAVQRIPSDRAAHESQVVDSKCKCSVM